MLGNFSRCVVLQRPFHLERDSNREEIEERRAAFEHARDIREEDTTGYEAPDLLVYDDYNAPPGTYTLQYMRLLCQPHTLSCCFIPLF